jgi:hypothetical protein
MWFTHKIVHYSAIKRKSTDAWVQPVWTSKTIYKEKEIRCNRSHIVWFYNRSLNCFCWKAVTHHKLIKCRRKAWHPCLYTESFNLQQSWDPEKSGLIDNIFTRRHRRNCPLEKEQQSLFLTRLILSSDDSKITSLELLSKPVILDCRSWIHVLAKWTNKGARPRIKQAQSSLKG